MDRFSWDIFWRDLSDSYAGRPLSPIISDFREHVLRERSTQFWDVGNEPVLRQPTELPYDRSAPAVRSGVKGVRRFDIDDKLTHQVRESASLLRVGTEMVGLAVVAVLLGRYCRTDSVVVGVTPSDAGRDHAQPLGAVHEPLPIALDLSGSPTFEQLVVRCARAVRMPGWKTRPPLGALIERVSPPRDLTRPTLVQVSYQAHEPAQMGFPGCVVEQVELPAGVLRTDLAFVVADRGGRWSWTVEYDTELYEDETADRLVREFQCLLADCVGNQGMPVMSLGRAPQPPAPNPVPSSQAITAAWRDTAVRQPDACAVSLGDERLDYRLLHQWSDEVARWLGDRGVGPEVPVGVVGKRRTATVAMVLGILKCGGVFVPLPVDLRDAFAGLPRLDIVLDPADPPVSRPTDDTDRDPPSVDIAPDNLFAYYRTSGSTGRPKVIATTHRGIQHYRAYLRDVIGLSAADVVLQIAPLTFDASIRDLLCPLATGAQVRLLSDENARDPFEVSAAVQDTGVTAILAIVPSMLAQVVDTAEGTAPRLRLILVSGEKLDADLALRVRGWAPNARIVNQCGATECTMTSTYHEVSDADIARGVIPIGRTIATAQGYVLDVHGMPVPPGAPGELHLAGPGLNRGYTSPALTASSYVPNPFGPPGSRMFRTGDLVRVSTSGALLHQGRTDHQVKVRGMRVDLEACEAALRRCPGVQAAAATLRNGDLVGYVVGSADGSELRRQLAERLPSAMVPNRYVRLAELPFTATGKVDRRALPDPRAMRERGPSVGPRDAAELRMRACWEDVLERERIGVHDDFFALGGTSLAVARLVRNVNRLPGVELSMAQVFTSPTIEDLCAAEPRMACAAAGHLLRLRKGHPGASPIVVLPDLTGSAARYQRLADEFSGESTILAMEAVGRTPEEQPLRTIADMAAACVSELGRVSDVPIAIAGPDAVPDATGGTPKDNQYSRRPAGDARNRPDPGSHRPGHLKHDLGQQPVTLCGWGVGARVAVALAVLLERLGTPPRLVVAVHPEAEQSADLSPAGRYATACGLPVVGSLDDDAAVAATLRNHKRQGQLPACATHETMRRLIAVFVAAEMAQEDATSDSLLATDLIHVHSGGSPDPGRCAWVRTTGRTRHVGTSSRLAAVPGHDDLRVVGGYLGRELGHG
ncbi:amino acid adenylation domain-containing protein [Actinocrispum wychmicini]|uniref:Amino acid adenylation domain-containing protein n=2 Tax=Actinocrispum wychmicini TaxID=1213861 RepID=A0A4R2J8I4_9PSEU|nr:amino acid adenylation domain-containing protein [Actinocrispum wychmicini]